ncbi:MAG TPA: helix-turn-helix domain-containing protein [Dissulfurispiraceae bacterium]|nr:helix-turn-helix domain-containing protein [Dissulfurispiraceae bacterium]
MKLSGGNQTKAASMLGVTRQALNKILKKKF